MRPLRGFTVFGSAVLLFGGLAAYSAAQTPGDQSAPPASYGPGMMSGWGGGYGPGPGMMGGWGGGYAPGMMNGWGGGGWKAKSGPAASETMFAALKQELNITQAQSADWDTYTTAVTAADQAMWPAMRALLQGATAKTAPDDQFTLMSQMIDLRKQDFDKKHAAAQALLPHLTAFQSGQATEILPGLAEAGRGMAGCGRGFGREGMWQGMMGFGGPPF
ncbi:hypothetical protein GCM10010909_09330 [Acidocella aquatica]|uniref:LTXXQ motif family protein n=1 Tax=Acidocella aquatica TaxID=1922313 RepID=A0ABQ6A4K4_9PROT|nr:Spy/CpxP family protein refolding chaperone [Acidocella aquatica]GLR66253.1 hypothetical protein GCM10010909_09330 [Acidocella aquatica]